MKKILLIGKTDGFYNELNERLSEHYLVRFGSSEPIAVFAIMKSFRPDLIVIRLAGTESSVLPRVISEHPDIRIVIIGEMSDAAQTTLPASAVACGENVQSVCEAVSGMLPCAPGDDRPPVTVMVIDDDAAMLRMVKIMLEDEYDVMLSPSGLKAMKLIERKCPDVILLDYEMPEMNGVQTLMKLRENERYAKIPVIFLTGAVTPSVIEEMQTVKPEGYLVKPADAPDIKNAINKAVGR